MLVLMLNNEFPPLGGGTGTVNQALFQRFAQIPDLEIDLITSALGRRFEQEQFSEHIRILKVPVNNRNIHHSSNRELLVYAVRALNLALRLCRQQTYALCMAWSAVPAGGVALALRRLTGLRYLVRVCGPDIPGFEQRYSQVTRLLRPAIRSIWRHAETVVAKCEEEAQMIHDVDKDVEVTIIPNGVDLERFRPGTPPSPNGPLRLLCVGRLIERKGQRYLIEAVKRLVKNGVNVTLDLVGTGDAETAYRQQVRELGLEAYVRFQGYIPRAEMPTCYKAADVFVLPSYNEGMSVATLEAMASGLPVVVTRTGGMRDLVVERENGFTFVWADIATLTRHLRYFVWDRALVHRMGAAARARVKSLSWDEIAHQYQVLFEQMVVGDC
jgi:glycosyltransferase involved in cell wall biosynthesis